MTIEDLGAFDPGYTRNPNEFIQIPLIERLNKNGSRNVNKKDIY